MTNNNEKNIYYTVKDEEGMLRPKAVLWPAYGRMADAYKPDIEEYMKKAAKEGLVLVKIKIEEITEDPSQT